MKEFRFCVGSKQGKRSSVWKFWVSKNDVYIQSRMMGSDMKVSLHESGLCQFSMTGDWIKKTGKYNSERHIVRWQREEPEKVSVIHLFRIIIPESELRVVNVSEKLSKVTWINAPPFGYTTLVECYLTPPSVKPISNKSFPYSLLTSFQLIDQKWFVALIHQEIVTEENSRILYDARREMLKRAMEVGVELRPEYRSAFFLKAPNDARGLIEVVPLVDTP
jgi:hypothetical protein